MHMQLKYLFIVVFSLALFACSEQPMKSQDTSLEPSEIAFDDVSFVDTIELMDGPAAKVSTSSCYGYHGYNDGDDNSKWAADTVTADEPDACHEWTMSGQRTVTMGFRINQGEDFKWKVVRVQGGASGWVTIRHDGGVKWYGINLPAGDYRLETKFVDVADDDEDETSYITVIRW